MSAMLALEDALRQLRDLREQEEWAERLRADVEAALRDRVDPSRGLVVAIDRPGRTHAIYVSEFVPGDSLYLLDPEAIGRG